MSHLRKPGDRDLTGYDPGRNLQLLPVGKKTSFYLIGGDGLDVSTDDESVAVATVGASDDRAVRRDGTLSSWERNQVIRIVRLNGRAPGSTLLRARFQGSDWIAPLTVRVTQEPDARQVGKGKAEVTPELRGEIRDLRLRDAVIRVAEDQMNSAISREGRGFGAYNMAGNLDWCGGFAYWCWDQACAIRGEENPFGEKNTVLWSPQRALHWGMQDRTPAHILRWSGSSPMDGKGRQDFHDIGWNGYDLRRGDIVLLRKEHAGGWKHVCMVHSVSGPELMTIDGNQGRPSIKIVKRDLLAKLPDRSWHLVFLAVMRA